MGLICGLFLCLDRGGGCCVGAEALKTEPTAVEKLQSLEVCMRGPKASGAAE